MYEVVLVAPCHRSLCYTKGEVCGFPALTSRDDGSTCKESAPPSGGVRLFGPRFKQDRRSMLAFVSIPPYQDAEKRSPYAQQSLDFIDRITDAL